MRPIRTVLLIACVLVPALARAADTPCSKSDYVQGRRQFAELYRQGKYAEATRGLTRIKQACSAILDDTERGWLVSDLALGHAKAGQPEECRRVAGQAPPALDPESRVAKAIRFNLLHCQGQPTQAVAPVPTPPPAGARPVQVLAALKEAVPGPPAEALQQAWEEPRRIRDGQLGGRTSRTIRRCTEIGNATPDDMEAGADHEYYGIVDTWLRCRALELVARGKPATQGFVRDIPTMKNPGSRLPAAMGLAVSNEEEAEMQAAERAGKSWQSFARKLRFEADPGRPQLRVIGDDFGGYLEWWAVGDFDGDGYDDLIAYRSIGPDEGTESDPAAFLLTRKEPQGVLKLLRKL